MLHSVTVGEKEGEGEGELTDNRHMILCVHCIAVDEHGNRGSHVQCWAKSICTHKSTVNPIQGQVTGEWFFPEHQSKLI